MADRFDIDRWPGRDQAVTLSDGRGVCVRHYGDEAGLPLVMLHGTPGSRIMFAGMDGFARAKNVHIIALDRWAYGRSEASFRPTLAAFADDVREITETLGIGRFAVAGVSGGGPYAVAVACGMADRVIATGLISPVGLISAAQNVGEVDLFHRFCFQALPRLPRLIEGIFWGYANAVRASAGLACGLSTWRAPAADKAIMADCATSDRLLSAFHEGLRRSTRGPAIDLNLFRELPGLALDQARAPARVWIGTADRNVPVAAAQRLARALPNATLVDLAGAGHLWVAQHYDVILDWVVSAARQPQLEWPQVEHSQQPSRRT